MNNMEKPQSKNKSEKSGIMGFGKKITLGLGLLLGGAGVASAQSATVEDPVDSSKGQENSIVENATPSEIQAAYDHYNADKQWLLGVIKSPAYKERLMKEGFSEADAQSEVDIRYQNLLKTPIDVKPEMRPYVAEDSVSKITGQFVSDSINPRVEVPPIGYMDYANRHLMVHEGDHASTNASSEISDSASALYDEAFILLNDAPVPYDTLMNMPGIVHNANRSFSLDPNAPTETREAYQKYLNWYDYFKNATELHARQEVLQKDMEELGIKQYGEEFTQKHLDKLYQRWNELSPNSQEYLNHIRNDKIIHILNTVAQFTPGSDIGTPQAGGQA